MGGPRPPRGPRFFWGPRWGFGPRYRGGCFSFVMVFVVIIVLAIFLGIFSFCGSRTGTRDDNGITQSTVNRTPMSASLVTPIDTYFESKSGKFQITDDLSVTDAMRYFFDKTGVQPYLYVLDEIDGDTRPTTSAVMNEGFRRYAELFGSDEGHLLVTLFYYSNYEYDFYVDLIVGDNAVSVMDSEACQILRDNMIYYLERNYTVDEAVEQAFRAAADNIMGGAKKSGSGSILTPIVIILIVAAVIALVVYFVQKKKRGSDGTENQSYGDGVYRG